MSAIGPGDFVEAVFSSWEWKGFAAVDVGALYRVDRFVGPATGPGRECRHCGNDSPVALLLSCDAPEVPNAGRCECQFRPIYRPNADLIASLLAPAPAEAAPCVPA